MKPSDSEVPNLLAQALECVPAGEIIEGTIYAYRDWSAQPYCDLILAQFSAEEILSLFLNVEAPDSNMKVGVLGILEDTPVCTCIGTMNKPNLLHARLLGRLTPEDHLGLRKRPRHPR
jgi:hypothetical protein